jgi:hypothetical protein
MPPVSEKQRRAMWAAVSGHSTLGIPKSVGEEFVGKDAAPKPEKNDRSVFEFMTPPQSAADLVKEQFAQCIVCRMLVPEKEMPAEGKHKKDCDLCVLVGSQHAVDGGKDRGSCGSYAMWPTPDGMPDPDVVAEHAKKLASGAPGSASKEELGYVERPVRCENCFYVDGDEDECKLYELLNEKLPSWFNSDIRITPYSCCNTNTAKPESEGASDGMGVLRTLMRGLGK